MELKKEDFILVTVLDGRKVLALRPDYFNEKSTEEKIKEVFETKSPIEIEIVESKELTAEELAEIEKAEKIAKLEEELAKAKGE